MTALHRAFGRLWPAVWPCLFPWSVATVAYLLVVRAAFLVPYVGQPLGYATGGVGLILLEATFGRIWTRTRP